MTILLLAGTREARDLSQQLPQERLISSLAGRTSRPFALGGRLRVGGFGGPDGLERFLRTENITHLIDATHPFAAQMSRHASEAARACQIPLLRLIRPPWDLRPGWEEAESLKAAARALTPSGRAFLATGRGSLAYFKARTDVWMAVRVIGGEGGDFPLASGCFVTGNPPFSIEEEIATLRALGVDTLVTRNSGGTGGFEKIAAAEQLGLRIIIVRRPVLAPAQEAPDAGSALAFIRKNKWLDA